MNKRNMLLISICLLVICGCDKDDTSVTTGIVGTVEYGQGDCMPSPEPKVREYYGYTGTIFFIEKEDLDNLGDGNYDNLKSSINIKIKNGNLATELPPGTYLVELEDVYLYAAENTIVIKSEEITYKDFKFFKCTSY